MIRHRGGTSNRGFPNSFSQYSIEIYFIYIYIYIYTYIYIGTVYKQISIDAKLKTEERSKNRADWEKSVKEAKVRIGL